MLVLNGIACSLFSVYSLYRNKILCMALGCSDKVERIEVERQVPAGEK